MNEVKKTLTRIVRPAINPIEVIANKLFESQIVVHIMHLQAKTKSYAEHKALEEYYTQIDSLVDDLVEKSYVEYGIIQNYKINIDSSQFKDSCYYLKQVYDTVMTNRERVATGYIQQIIDNILDLTAGVIYKLENFK